MGGAGRLWCRGGGIGADRRKADTPIPYISADQAATIWRMRRSRIIEILASAGGSAAFGIGKFWLDRHPVAIPDWVDPLLLPAAGVLAAVTLFLWFRPDASHDQPGSTGNQTVTAGRDASGVTGFGSGITANNFIVNLPPPVRAPERESKPPPEPAKSRPAIHPELSQPEEPVHASNLYFLDSRVLGVRARPAISYRGDVVASIYDRLQQGKLKAWGRKSTGHPPTVPHPRPLREFIDRSFWKENTIEELDRWLKKSEHFDHNRPALTITKPVDGERTNAIHYWDLVFSYEDIQMLWPPQRI
jgi:hypothetical protein